MNWAQDRPNNFGGPLQEYCLEMNHNQDQIGQWNDIVCIDGFATSYICQKYPTCKRYGYPFAFLDFMSILILSMLPKMHV